MTARFCRSARSVAIGLGLLASAGCSRVADATPPRPIVRLATGFPDLLTAYSKALPDITFVITDGGTAQSHLNALQRGSADLGAAMADVAYQAYVGTADNDKPLNHLRGIAVLRPSTMHLLVRPGLTVTTVADLRGRRVALGIPDSETSLAAKMILSAFGLSESDIHGELAPYPATLKRMESGDVDAAFISGGRAKEFVVAAMQAGASLIDVQGPAVDQLRNGYPFLRRTLIPAGTFATQRNPVYTVSVDTVLVCRGDLDEALVYRLTKALVEALPLLSSQSTYFQNIDFRRVTTTPIPLHPGAARYYRERELFQ